MAVYFFYSEAGSLNSIRAVIFVLFGDYKGPDKAK